MKNSTKILIGVVVIALIGAGVYFGNTGLQKGSLIGISKICKSEPTIFYSNIIKAPYTNFEDFYNYLKNELDSLKGNVLCPYILELSTPKPGGESSTTLTCKSLELTTGVTNSGNKFIQCHKQLNEGWVEGVLYYNSNNPVARVYTATEGFGQDIELSKIKVKKY